MAILQTNISYADVGYSKLINYIVYFVFMLAWFVSPFITLFTLFGAFYMAKVTEKETIFFYVLIALSFALLAYTNKSTAELSGSTTTDIVRYYKAFYPYASLTLSEALPLAFVFAGIEPVFAVVNAVVVSLTGDVQMISFFWIFIVYFLYFLSLKNYMKYRNISLSSHRLFFLVFISLFGFILFTQVTEVLRQAIATSIFTYGFTLKLLNKKKGYIFVLLSLGVHASVFFLLLLLLHKKISKNGLFVLFAASCFLAIFSVMKIVSFVLPNVGFWGILQEKALFYGQDLKGFHNSKRYLILSCVYLFMVLYVQYKVKPPFAVLRIGYLYFFILLMNFSVPHNFLRLVNMSHFFYAFFFIEILNDVYVKKQSRFYFMTVVSIIFISLNLTMTRSRTVGGGYTSAYMDNSIGKIIFSSVPAFFEQKHYSTK